MQRIPTLGVIITAAGLSERFNKDRDEKVKKEYLKLDEHSVLYKATEPFFELPSLVAVVVTCPKGSEDECAVALEDLANINAIPLLIVDGGESRTESVKRALERLKALPFSFDYIAIHDGARPYVTPDLIIKTLATATVAGGAAPARRITDAIKQLSPSGFIGDSVDRSTLITVQTPQIFKSDLLFDAYERLSDGESYVDDVEVFERAGYKVLASQGEEGNKKITYFQDIPNAEAQIEEYIKAREKGRDSAKATRRMRELMNKGE